MKNMLKNVLDEIKPTNEEEKQFVDSVNAFLKKLNNRLKDSKAILGGSGAKGTWLRNIYDVDIFVRFNYQKYKDKSDKISGLLEKNLKGFRALKLHGSRDYFQVRTGKFVFEVIPILDIKKPSQAKNITDISPLHAEWVLKNKKFCDDIRLLKKFCKANNVYGAESYINGFSGYVCEILTVYYKGFEGFIREAAKWKPKVVVDIKKYHKNALNEINMSKIGGPLVVVDPVQKGRNAAAALSYEKFYRLIDACRRFLRKPSKDFFKEERISFEDLKKKAKDNKLVVLDVRTKQGKVDVVGCKVMKVFEFVNKGIVFNEFSLLDSGWEYDKKDKAVLWFILKKEKLDKLKEWQGPPLKSKQNVERFKKKHKNVFVKSGRVYAKVKRDFVVADDLVRGLVRDTYVREKVSSVKIHNV